MDACRALQILVVDDHRDTVEVFALVLRQRGHHAFTATSYSEALEMMRERSFDLLVADMELPDGDGLQLLPNLRERCPSARGIVLSGFHDPDSMQRAQQKGFDDYVIKPATIERIDAAICKCASQFVPSASPRSVPV